jgi:plastocyanin
MKLASSRLRARGAPVAIGAALVALAVVVPGLASGSTPSEGAEGGVATVRMQVSGKTLKFVAPKTVDQGDTLRIVNKTNPHEVGPHTFSLVAKGTLPKTPKQRKVCFTPHHICMAIASWHTGSKKGQGPPKINPVEVGPEGWSTEGSLTKKGDSWFTGNKPGTSFEQQVTAAAGTTLHFICAIHPWMQGSIKVLPEGS